MKKKILEKNNKAKAKTVAKKAPAKKAVAKNTKKVNVKNNKGELFFFFFKQK